MCSIAPPMKPPMISGSKYGIDHPPCWNPPSVSSSAPPGACTMPSRLMNSLITIRMQVGRCHGSELIAAGPRRRPITRPASGRWVRVRASSRLRGRPRGGGGTTARSSRGSVAPPRVHQTRWWASHHDAGARHPGNWQCSSRSTIARRSRSGTVRVRRPRSRSWLPAPITTRPIAQSHRSRSAVMRGIGPKPSMSHCSTSSSCSGWPASSASDTTMLGARDRSRLGQRLRPGRVHTAARGRRIGVAQRIGCRPRLRVAGGRRGRRSRWRWPRDRRTR